MAVAIESPIRLTQRLGVEFWNDSCRLSELRHAAQLGAAGATSNPVIVGAAVEAEPETWLPFIAALARKEPRASEDDLAWRLIEEVARVGARALAPVHKKTAGAQGWLCLQVNPKHYRDPERMLEQALLLSKLAANIAIKVPAVEPGLEVMEELIAAGVPVNATVSFTVAQAVACAQAMERGRKRAGKPVPGYVTLMVGRIDDHVKRLAAQGGTPLPPAVLDLAGIAVFKAAHKIFLRRKFQSRLLVAAYRHERHWTDLIGPGVVQSIPYNWWTRFDQSKVEVKTTLQEPVDEAVVHRLRESIADFRRAHDEEGLRPADFARYGASVHTLEQFIAGYHKVLDVVRRQMFAA